MSELYGKSKRWWMFGEDEVILLMWVRVLQVLPPARLFAKANPRNSPVRLEK